MKLNPVFKNEVKLSSRSMRNSWLVFLYNGVLLVVSMMVFYTMLQPAHYGYSIDYSEMVSLYAVLAYNHVFSRAACLSPSIWFATDQLDRLLATARIRPDTVIYMDYGSRELPFHSSMKRQFGRVAAKLLERGVMLQSRIVPWGNHSEASWEEQIPFFMDTLLYHLD